MKVTCQRDALLAAVSAVGAAVAARSTRPILACIKAVAADDTLVLMGTDSELGLRHELRGVAVTRPGAAVLPPAKLASILKETSDADITLDADDAATRIKLSTGRYELPAGNPDEFPDTPEFVPGERYHEVAAGVLKTLIKRTVFAAEKRESTRWAVTGLLWEADGDRVRLVGTDTKRLALADGPAVVCGEADPRMPLAIVPVKAVTLLERNLTDDGEVVTVVLRANEAMFQTAGGRVVLHTKLVEGRFPPYAEILPKTAPVKFPVSVPDLTARVRQAAIPCDDENKRVECRFGAGKATLSAKGPETGSSDVEMELPGYIGEPVGVAFDPGYLTDMLRAIDGEPTAAVEMTNGDKPVVFKVGATYVYLVMPLAG